MEVLPSVHGVFLKRMLRHMLETPGVIGDRDYERLAFVLGILLSEKCQDEEEDSEEELKRLEDGLYALAILKDYTSPFPVDSHGKRMINATFSTSSVAASGDANEARWLFTVWHQIRMHKASMAVKRGN